jgi:hypothetical protein
MTAAELTIVAALTAAIALWGQISWVLGWLRSLVVVTRELEGDAALMLHSYLMTTGRRRRTGNRSQFGVSRAWSKSATRYIRVVYEWLRGGPQVYRISKIGWLWTVTEILDTGTNGRPAYWFSFVRWSLDFERLLVAAAAWADDESMSRQSRFGTHHHSGDHFSDTQRTRPAMYPETQETKTAEPADAKFGAGDFDGVAHGNRILNAEESDLGHPETPGLDVLSLRPEIHEVVTEFGRIINDRQWFTDHRVAWRFGWLLHGPPGTGKTSLVRALGVEHDLPVHVLDLSGMTNSQLANSWRAVQNYSPCIALFEDLDGVYHGRDPAPGAEGPTFDALLQALGGVEIAEGVFVFVTTNKLEHIDPALRRGGRLDRTVEVLGLDHEGRLKLARRILEDEHEVAQMMLSPDVESLSPADFQERCRRRAMAIRYGDPNG